MEHLQEHEGAKDGDQDDSRHHHRGTCGAAAINSPPNQDPHRVAAEITELAAS